MQRGGQPQSSSNQCKTEQKSVEGWIMYLLSLRPFKNVAPFPTARAELQARSPGRSVTHRRLGRACGARCCVDKCEKIVSLQPLQETGAVIAPQNSTDWQRRDRGPVLLDNRATRAAYALHSAAWDLNPPALRKSIAWAGNLEAFFYLVPLTTDLYVCL